MWKDFRALFNRSPVFRGSFITAAIGVLTLFLASPDGSSGGGGQPAQQAAAPAGRAAPPLNSATPAGAGSAPTGGGTTPSGSPSNPISQGLGLAKDVVDKVSGQSP